MTLIPSVYNVVVKVRSHNYSEHSKRYNPG